MSAFGYTESNPDYTEYKGNKFVFAYYSPSDKCWYVQPRRFFLTPNSRGNNMLGQFIQSNWFNVMYKKTSIALFVIMKVKKECSINTIEKDMNRRNSTAKNRVQKKKAKTRKKRQELSCSATKSIRKEEVEIVVKFD